AVQVSQDNLRVFLQIGNVAKTDRVLKVSPAGIRSASGGSLFFGTAYFTHNFQSNEPFNPLVTRVVEGPDRFLENHVAWKAEGRMLSVSVDLQGSYAVSLHALDGAALETRAGAGPGRYAFAGARHGLHVLRVTQGKRAWAKPVFL